MSKTSSSLTNQYNKFSAAWLQNASDPWNHDGATHNILNHTKEEFIFNPADGNGSPAAGTTVTFKIINRGPKAVESPILTFTRSGLTQTLATSQGSFVQPGGYGLIREVRCVYANKIFWRISGQRLWQRYKKEISKMDRINRNFLVGADILAFDDAVVDATNARTYQVPLYVPWSEIRHALHIESLPDGVNIEVDFATVAQCVRYLGSTAPTFTLSSVTLKQWFVFIPRKLADSYYQQGFSGAGWTWKGQTYQYQRQDLSTTTGTSPYNIPLRNITNDVSRLDIYIQKSKQQQLTACTAVTTVAGSSAFAAAGLWDNINFSTLGKNFAPLAIDLTDGSNSVMTVADNNTARHKLLYESQMFPEAPLDRSESTISFCGNLADTNTNSVWNNMGFRNLTGYADPTLQLTLHSATQGWQMNALTNSAFYAPSRFKTWSVISAVDGGTAETTSTAAYWGDYIAGVSVISANCQVIIEAHVHNVFQHKNGDYTTIYKVQ